MPENLKQETKCKIFHIASFSAIMAPGASALLFSAGFLREPLSGSGIIGALMMAIYFFIYVMKTYN